jgi:DNA mismatch repair protein MutS2
VSQLSSNPAYDFVDVLRKLEFDKVVERISKLAYSESGRQQALRLSPQHDHALIALELRKVSEAKELLIAEDAIPIDGFKNVVTALKKTSVENQVLTIVELLEIAATIRVSRTLKIFLAKRVSQYPTVGVYHERLYADKIVEHHIFDALDERGFVKDTASRELREIRRSMVFANEALRKKLESILRNVAQQEYLQDDIVTTRDGRFVIPIKSEYKHSVPGFIHSSSSSGATVFVEPAESLELNNALRELQLREQREIHRILADLTKQVSEIRDPLTVSYSALIELDVIFARGKYSIEVCGNPPLLSPVPRIKLTNARHPILLQHLKRDKTIPLSIELGGHTQTLIITGPNAGGKTVTMKTVGLLALCAQSGIHIPADSDSEIFPFQKIFVDIGDDQSIENDLSTFSSHLNSLHKILADADAESLILIDEIGAGTDPSEGSALAAAVLQDLTVRQAITIATTHHGILKVFAHETSGMSNASMEFNQESLMPTYRFRSGIPGSSYAFELAERLGISHNLLNQARAQMGDEKTKLESLLQNLERQAQEYQIQLHQTAKEKERLESLVLSYEQKTLQLKRELGTIRKKAVEEAKEIVQQAHLKVEQSVKEIRESGAQQNIVRSSRQILKKLGEDLENYTIEEEKVTQHAENINKGDIVRIRDGHESGEVQEIQGKHAVILSGNARLRIPLADLHREQKRQKIIDTSPLSIRAPEAANEIDLRGLLGDEAIVLVQAFLDNAYAAGLHRVDIIHGKGTGALRKKIGEFVKSYPHVKAFRLGEWNEGGTGVTVVELT